MINTDSTIAPVWQLLVNSEGFVPGSAKYHCFVDDQSMCGRVCQNTAFYDDGITCSSSEILDRPMLVCKRCLAKWKREYQVEV